MLTSTVLGYPRIGSRREIKQALESYWDGRISKEELLAAGSAERQRTWQRLAQLGLTRIPSNTFSLYDQVLDTAVMVGAVPQRYQGLEPLDAYFAMARGGGSFAPLRMTKWFDTNYHYLVPEIEAGTQFALQAAKPLAEFREARTLGIETRPVLLGPITFLLLSKGSPLHRLPELLPVYAELLAQLHAEGATWVQLDEPALVCDHPPAELSHTYDFLGTQTARPKILVASYFGHLGEALPALASAPIEGVALDLVRGTLPTTDQLELLRGKTIFAGVISGRDVWRTDGTVARSALDSLQQVTDDVVVSSSCSLQHVPYDLGLEPDLDPAVRDRLAFAEQKVTEIVTLAAGRELPPLPATTAPSEVDTTSSSPRSPYAIRAAAQAAHLNLPLLPTTTIGSFPQTSTIRRARAAHVAGELSDDAYNAQIRDEIAHAIGVQERLGLDVLVHGEPERNDMVQYFAEHLDGCAVTRNGWVQSYGSRCTRPPIIYGDVTRPKPITVDWAVYAQSLTDRPVKGMLTGPITIVSWSFARRDIPLRDVVGQVAQAMRGEVQDLAAAGIRVIQVDEPALRELMPLRAEGQQDYLAWSVAAYRHATSGAPDDVQVHTHLCYSQAEEIVEAINLLDADVTTIESARSGATIFNGHNASTLTRALGAGVYDIHSPRIPSADEITQLIGRAVSVLGPERVWVNPDCGLKTRTYPQTEAALANMVDATQQARALL